MSIAGGPHKALYRGEEAGCQVIQIFTRYRVRWSAKKLSPAEIDAFHKGREELSVLPVAIHNSYLINLASPDSHVRKKSFSCLIKEIEWARHLEIPYLVMHPGSHMEKGENRGIKRIGDTLNRINDRTGDFKGKILLETTAGQGTNLGYQFEQLAEILARSDAKERMGVCLDTCHVFAAGYDFGSKRQYQEFINNFDRVIGLDRLMLIHINDSKRGLGSRVDRHEHPGKGRIGLNALAFLLNDPKFADHPFLLETPKGKNEKGEDLDIVNLNILKGLIKKTGYE